ncbi:hypothetical protein [Thiothrix sp.]|jgi:hypothetical protein|uniref:hypothetical protein n=1 Tax=Thiothrix sp. TaxID=1032 RepID=UPI00257D6ED4|nr:hypothetical protein [Thiothrix sp.]
MARVSLSAVLGLSLVLSACSTFEGYPDPPSGRTDALENIDKVLHQTLQHYSQEGDEIRRQDIRNALMRQRMVEIDFAYQAFEKKLHSENLRGSVYTDWASTALTAAVPGTSGSHSKNVLAGLSTFLTTSKSIYDSKVLAESTMPALIAEMRTSRAKSRGELLKRLQSPVGEYDIYSAWSDLNRYYEAGTLPSAITALNSAAISRSTIADTENDQTPIAESLALDSLLLTAPSETAPVTDVRDSPNDADNAVHDVVNVITPASPTLPAHVTEPIPTPAPDSLRPARPNPPSSTHTPIDMSKPAETLRTWIDGNTNNLFALEDWLKEQGQGMFVPKFLKDSSASNKELQRKAITTLMKPPVN